MGWYQLMARASQTFCSYIATKLLSYLTDLALAEEFTYELVYKDVDTEAVLAPTVALNLIRKHRNKYTGLVTLLFNVIYAPYTTML